ncbi:zinc finger protein 346 [Tribolium castaneum]|uniref:Zinc finger protein 385B-like Protein n=1 Tax=Tribolium castaneum TaxID=7070 RepID=A0A139WHH4_TRICA|nr:PREDICTED: zinc finger protein 346-like isoform X1 [Tribolium castaneum]KYB27334.1 Zinc finger protein 385B-like Protein [Tribolium castaneum]|eukprot:XP_008194233.1 PREDICTED: zinc finger protein 346-like isoform X1 [Tribolium castaneum]
MSEFHNSIEEVQLNEKNEENSDKNALSCELCNVKVTSVKILQRHLEGRRHKMKEERQGKTFVCELCDVVANSEIQLNIHLNSIKHKNKLMKKENFISDATGTAGLWILLFCVVCIFINLLLLFKVICQ